MRFALVVDPWICSSGNKLDFPHACRIGTWRRDGRGASYLSTPFEFDLEYSSDSKGPSICWSISDYGFLCEPRIFAALSEMGCTEDVYKWSKKAQATIAAPKSKNIRKLEKFICPKFPEVPIGCFDQDWKDIHPSELRAMDLLRLVNASDMILPPIFVISETKAGGPIFCNHESGALLIGLLQDEVRLVTDDQAVNK